MEPIKKAVIPFLMTGLLLATGCGGSEDGSSPAGDAGGAATASSEFDGSWSGATSQDIPISFTVTDGFVTEATIKWEPGGAKCGTESSQFVVQRDDIAIIDGRFEIMKPPLEGTFESVAAASGTGDFEAPSAEGCKPVSITWEATKS
jgi:hypothetical protein